MLRMAFSDVKKFLPRLPRRRTILVGLTVLVSAVLLLLWQLGQEILVQIIITVILGGFGLDFARRQTIAAEKSTSLETTPSRRAADLSLMIWT